MQCYKFDPFLLFYRAYAYLVSFPPTPHPQVGIRLCAMSCLMVNCTQLFFSLQVGSPTESKCGKSGLKSQDNSSQVQRSNHSDASKTTMKKLNRKERESPQKMKSEKSLPQAAFPTRQMQLRTLKREVSHTKPVF